MDEIVFSDSQNKEEGGWVPRLRIARLTILGCRVYREIVSKSVDLYLLPDNP